MTAQHWDEVFGSRDPQEVSWYREDPGTSLALIADTPGSVIDVGAGTSSLIDELLAVGRTELTVLDISEAALDQIRRRLAHRAALITFERADITTWQPERTYEVWHDRAVFHFLTNPADQYSYADLVTRAISPGGALVLGTFAMDGPTQCSGLPTARYSATGLADLFSVGFDLEQHLHENHETPTGTGQPFTWVKLRRRRPER